MRKKIAFLLGAVAPGGPGAGAPRPRPPPGRATPRGSPAAKPLWTRGMGGYIEYPPSYCDGVLYVNTFDGKTAAVDADTGRVIWPWVTDGLKPSTPAIDGPRLIVSSTDGTATAPGPPAWRGPWEAHT